jgi:hypothetical protein
MMSMNTKQQIQFADQIRQAVRESGSTPYRICQDAEIDQAMMSRFLAGKMWLGEATMNRLAAYLGLEVVKRKGK